MRAVRLMGLLIGCGIFISLNLLVVAFGGFPDPMQSVQRTTAESVLMLLSFLAWAAAVFGTAVLVESISGSWEVLVAVSAAILVEAGGSASSNGILSEAMLPSTMLSLSLLTLSAIGASLVFFARRSDLR
jgi:hypothetical protein